MPDVYISRSGMENKDLDEKFESTKLEDLNIKIQKQEEENRIIREDLETLKKAAESKDEEFAQKVMEMVQRIEMVQRTGKATKPQLKIKN